MTAYFHKISLSFLWLLLSGTMVVKAQLKLGNNPTQIHRASILEMESAEQGLLLPRIQDTNLINILYPADGMIIYFTDENNSGTNAGVYERRKERWMRSGIRLNTVIAQRPESPKFIFQDGLYTLNLANASTGRRGLVSTGLQTWEGPKTFNDSLTLKKTLSVANGSGNYGDILKSQGPDDPPIWSNPAGLVGLSDLTDVSIDEDNLQHDQILQYNLSTHKWENTDFDPNNYLIGTRIQTPGDENLRRIITPVLSDIHYKRNLTRLSQVLDILDSLNSYTYFFRTEDFPDKNLPEDPQIGLIAQEVEKYFPQLVVTDRDGYKSLDYGRFSAVLLEAIKEQKKESESLREEIQKQEMKLKEISDYLIILEKRFPLRDH